MDQETIEKPVSGLSRLRAAKPKDWTLLVLRIACFLATASATLVMALNKETKTLVIATIGSNPITVKITAKFQYNPAFVFFVIANAIAGLYNLLMITVGIFRHKFNDKPLLLAMIPILDALILALVSAGDGAAVFMAELAKNGNSHSRWNKTCDRFGDYCHRSGGALIASFIGLALSFIITVLSIINLLSKPTPINNNDNNTVTDPQ